MDDSYKRVYLHKSKTEAFVDKKARTTEEEFFESEKHYLFNIIKNNLKILDVGCAAGGLYNVLKANFENINYTGIDIDPLCIEEAKKRYPEAKFISGDFFENKFDEDSFDVVISLLTTSMQPEYRRYIRELVRISNKYIVFDTRLKYEGPTIIDKEISYFYYHSSGERNYYIVYNIFELLNFLHNESLHLKNISVYGYYAKDRTSAFIPLPKNKLLIGMFCLEKYPVDDRNKILRRGGFKEDANRPWCSLDINMPGFQKEWF